MKLITGFAFTLRDAARPNPPDGQRAIFAFRTTTPSWALPTVAHQTAASHGFTFPFTALYDRENNDDFQRPQFKIKMETSFFFFFFLFKLRSSVNARGETEGCCVSVRVSHMENLFKSLAISNLPGPLCAPQSLCSAARRIWLCWSWAELQSSTSKLHPLWVRQMSRGHF